MMIHTLVRALLPEKQRIALLMTGMRLRSLTLRGKAFTCNCCGRSFRKFLPYGNQPRPNALCPWCHSLERTRVLMAYLERETRVFNLGTRTLHFAPEGSILKRIKRSARPGDYIAADINPALGEVVADITRIPYPDNSFDYVICSHVLGHVPDEPRAIDEIYRVLTPGGEALVMTLLDLRNPVTLEDAGVTTAQERLARYGEPDLVRRHGRDFAHRLQRPGILIEEIDYAAHMKGEERRRMSTGNGERELIFRCTKVQQ